MSQKSDKAVTSRRDFLKLATTAAPAAVAAVALGGTEAEAAAPAQASGMQNTSHTRAYYDSARF
ncbi:MAG: ubiquinol-cytochrome c reductase iron-sulfur subunit N-terminal domain-containing protein [Pseudorhodobacter sp.]|nr:ubiquinol-cytochrome c reductase iron-sulfur subunit N-terminal domain-containing protein [Pseudorhodobacter sp.]